MLQETLRAYAALVGFVALATGSSAVAHHGGALEWGAEARGPLTGVVTEFAFRFPHVQALVDVEDGSGATVQWTLISRWTPTILRRHGWSRDSIEPGDTVTVMYLPHVDSQTVGAITRIDVNGEPLSLDF